MKKSDELYLLDTNIIIHAVRATDVWRKVNAAYGLMTTAMTPLLSRVTDGELRSFAVQRNWGPTKLEQLEFHMLHFAVKSIDEAEIVQTYANLDAYAVSMGVTMGKNDLWIAATAVVTGATLLTTDRDFDLFAPRFLHRLWLDPNATTT